MRKPCGFTHPTNRSKHGQQERFDISAALALAATVAGESYFRSAGRGAKAHLALPGLAVGWVYAGRTEDHAEMLEIGGIMK